MPLIVNNNPASIAAQRSLTVNTNQLQRSVERLSSGLRITRAADDAAGLAVSETLRAQIRSISILRRFKPSGDLSTLPTRTVAASQWHSTKNFQ